MTEGGARRGASLGPAGWAILAATALAVVAADQATKYLAVRDLTRLFERARVERLAERVDLFYSERHIEHLARPPAVVIPGLWQDRYAENPGAAFSLLQRMPPTFRRVFFVVVTLLAVAFVVLMASRASPARRWYVAALGGLLGGVVGNFVDRFTRGYVIDFVDWHLGDSPRLHFPTFNVADLGISIGAMVLLWQVVREALTRDA